MSAVLTKIHNGAVSVATIYAPSAVTTPGGIPLTEKSDIGFVIVQPADTTTAYTVQVSNMTDEEALSGVDDWATYDTITELTLSAAGKDFIEFLDCPFARVRLKMVTSSGTGVVVVRSCAKDSA